MLSGNFVKKMEANIKTVQKSSVQLSETLLVGGGGTSKLIAPLGRRPQGLHRQLMPVCHRGHYMRG